MFMQPVNVETADQSSNALSTIHGSTAAIPVRQRGLWSFLTWSFFLANFMTFFEGAEGSARAASADADPHHGLQPVADDHPWGPGAGDFSRAALEGPSLTQDSASPDLKTAMNPINPAGVAPFTLQPTETPAMPDHSFQASASQAASGSGGVVVDGNTSNNFFFSQDSHDLYNALTNNHFNFDHHDSLHVGEILQPIVTTVDSTIQIVGELVHDTTVLAEHTIDTVVSTVADLAGTAAGVVETVLPGVTGTVAGVVEGAAGTVGAIVQSSPVITAASSALDVLHATMGDLVSHRRARSHSASTLTTHRVMRARRSGDIRNTTWPFKMPPHMRS
jgi:hypothetical protein